MEEDQQKFDLLEHVAEAEQLAEEALMHTDGTVRDAAAAKLRILSHYDQYKNVQELMCRTQSDALLFMCAKGLCFLVVNEIGPSERSDVQRFILELLSERKYNNVVLNQLLTVYAAALFQNWRMTIITMEENENDETPTVGAKIRETLSNALGPSNEWLVLKTIREILIYFAHEDAKYPLASVRNTFSTQVLPNFFEYAVSCLQRDPSTLSGGEREADAMRALALSVCCATLQYVPPTASRIISTTRDETLILSPIKSWYETITACFTFCRDFVLRSVREVTFFDNEDYVNALQCCTYVSCVSTQQMNSDLGPGTKESYVTHLLAASQKMLEAYTIGENNYGGVNSDAAYPLSLLLRAALRVFANVFERQGTIVAHALVCEHPRFVESLGTTVVTLCSMWDEDNEESRELLATIMKLVLMHTHESMTGSGALRTIAVQSFQRQLNAVMEHCHQGDEEVNSLERKEGFELAGDRYLRPLARLFAADFPSITPIVDTLFKEITSQYNVVLRLKAGEDVHHDAILSLMLESSVTDLSAGNKEAFVAGTQRVILCRLATLTQLISFALHMRHTSSIFFESDSRDKALVHSVVDFTSNFLQQDLTDALLCLDISFGDDNNNSANTNGTSNNDHSKSAGKPQINHAGIQERIYSPFLRAVMYFCQVVRQTSFIQQSKYVELSGRVVRYILEQHSFNDVLMFDAVLVLKEFAHDEVALVHSGIEDIFNMHFHNRIPLSSQDAVRQGIMDSKNQRKSRRKLMEAFTKIAVRRAQLTSSTAVSVMRLVEQLEVYIKEGAFGIAFSDLRGIAKGIDNTDYLFGFIEWFGEYCCCAKLTSANVKFSDEVLDEYVKLVSKLAATCSLVLHDEDLFSPLPTQFCIECFRCISAVIPTQQQGSGGGGGVSTLRLFHAARILKSVFTGHWCNVGVVSFYGDTSVEGALLSCLKALLSHDVDAIMSLVAKREAVFAGMLALLNFEFSSSHFWLKIVREENAIPLLIQFLTKCLMHTPLPDIIRCAECVLARALSADNVGRPVVVALFNESAVLLSTVGFEQDMVQTLCRVLQMCFALETEKCQETMNGLLDYCSAYHRVRLRCLAMMLKNPPNDMPVSYSCIFNNGVKTGKLAAW